MADNPTPETNIFGPTQSHPAQTAAAAPVAAVVEPVAPTAPDVPPQAAPPEAAPPVAPPAPPVAPLPPATVVVGEPATSPAKISIRDFCAKASTLPAYRKQVELLSAFHAIYGAKVTSGTEDHFAAALEDFAKTPA
jgi:hypothetical protein